MTRPSGTLWSFFFSLLKRRWLSLLFIQLLCLGWSLDQTLWPVIFGDLTDKVILQGDGPRTVWGTLSPLILWSIVLWFLVEMSSRSGNMLMAVTLPKIEADVRMTMFSYVQGHSHRFFADHLAGGIANKIADMARGIHDILQVFVSMVVPMFVTLLIAIVLFAFINPLFAALLAGWMALHTAICCYFAKECSRRSHEHSEARSTLAGALVDSISNHLTVKLFARQKYEQSYLGSYQHEEMAKNKSALLYSEKMKMALSWLCFIGTYLAINGYALYCWQKNTLTTGELVFVFNTIWNFTSMAWLVTLELPRLFTTFGTCRQALSVIHTPHDIIDAVGAVPLKVTRGAINFENIDFGYGKDLLFENLSVDIEAGQKVGLVGFSGAGKSTFVHLILRYYDVSSGTIWIDNQEIAKVSQASLHHQVAVIPQEATLFHRSLLENIRYGRSDATADEVIAAAKLAHCHDFIKELPDGYDTLVGDRGVKLSGGQRQRLAIARALVADAPILILDEATSALDSVTEKYIQQGLTYLTRGRTTIVVAHRLSTLVDMDRILVFSRGRIIEDGSHVQLLARNGHYANLWNMQVGGFLPEYDIGTHYA